MFSLKSLLIYLITFLIVIFTLAIWSSNLLFEWGTDFGVYYVGSYFIDEKYRIYNEFFTHKGPLYYLFIKIIGKFIGWGQWQAYFSLFSTMLVFYIPIIFILIRERIEPIAFISAVFISLCLLYKQDTNSSISFFQSGFLIISFWLLIRTKKIIHLNISFSFLICAILTRVDAIIYLPVYFAVLIYSNNINNPREYLRIFIVWTLITIIPFFLIMYLLDFNLNQYLVHNLEFNNWYKLFFADDNSLIYTFAKYLIRPTSFAIFTGSIFIIPFFILFTQLKSSLKELYYSVKNLFKNYNQVSHNVYILIILILGFIGWLFTASDRNFHIMIVLVPLLFFYLKNIYIFNIQQNLIVILSCSYCLIAILHVPIFKIYKDKECLFTIYCETSTLNQYTDTFSTLKEKKYDEINIIGDEGAWIYFYSNIKPKHAINNRWFYKYKKFFLTTGLLNQHSTLLETKGEYFLINNVLLKDRTNKNLDEILSKSALIKRESYFSIFQIK